MCASSQMIEVYRRDRSGLDNCHSFKYPSCGSLTSGFGPVAHLREEFFRVVHNLLMLTRRAFQILRMWLAAIALSGEHSQPCSAP